MMFSKKNVFGLGTWAFITVAVFSGCAAPVSNSSSGVLSESTRISQTRPEWLHSSWELMYSPRSQSAKTFEDALNDIRQYLDPSQSGGVFVEDRANKPGQWYFIQKCAVNAHMIQIQAKNQNNQETIAIAVNYADLMDHEIFVIEARGDNVNYAICMHHLIEFYFYKPTHVRTIADALFLIQQQYKEKRDKQFALFESQASQYRALTAKPTISEEQRKYVVQANALNMRKDYAGAVNQYQKVLDLNPVSYPGAYFNLALLSAQQHKFNTAIIYMKQYLLLEPEAKDARGAQDKIYEWELMIGK